MKLSKRKLLSLIESYLLEKEETEEGSEPKDEYDFGNEVSVELQDGTTLSFKGSDNGGVTATMKLASGNFPKDKDGKPIGAITLTKEDVEEKTDNLAMFSNVVGGALCAMRRDGMQNKITEILKKLNDLIDMTPVMKLRSALVYYDSLKLNDENSTQARIAEYSY